MSILFISNGNPHFIHLPPSEGMVYLIAQPYESGLAAERSDFMFGPVGEFFLPEVLQRYGHMSFDIVIFHADPAWSFTPLGVNQVTDKFVVIFGDMHHMNHSLAKAVAYAQRERPYAIASAFSRQHLHWFMAAGFANFLWEPSFFVTPTKYSLNTFTRKKQWMTFCGSTSSHPRRAKLLNWLKDRVSDFYFYQGTRQRIGEIFHDSALCLNMSLNGDFNMRCFEIAADGGLLVSDRISKYSGFYDVFSPGKDCLPYQTPEEVLEIVSSRGLVRQVAPSIIENSHSLYWSRFEPNMVWTRFIETIKSGTFPDRLSWDDRAFSSIERSQWLGVRISIYEMVQEIHRNFERVFVHLSAVAAPLVGADLDDLTRVFSLSDRDVEKEGDAVIFVGMQGEQPASSFTHQMHLVA